MELRRRTNESINILTYCECMGVSLNITSKASPLTRDSSGAFPATANEIPLIKSLR